MNKFKYYFLAALLSGFSFTFVSCEKDEDEPKDDNRQEVPGESSKEDSDIVGTWIKNDELSTLDTEMNPILANLVNGFMDFREMSKSIDIFGDSVVYRNDNTFASAVVKNGTYDVDGDQLRMNFDDNGKAIEIATGNILEISNVDFRCKVTRLSYDIVDSRLVVFLYTTFYADFLTMDLSSDGISREQIALVFESLGIDTNQEFSFNYKFYFDKK